MNFPTPEFRVIFGSKDFMKGIVSVWGAFGVGKTTFALQTALNTARLNEKSLYIYSKPNFPIEKVKNILQDDSEDILNNITFIKATNFESLNTIVFNLEFLILHNINNKEEKLNLIVVDSPTELYRIELNRDKKEKNFTLSHKLSQMMANLFFLNETYGIEILITNESSHINQEGQTIEAPSGGKVMNYWAWHSIKISRTDKLNERKISLTKHSENKKLEFSSKLTNSGFT